MKTLMTIRRPVTIALLAVVAAGALAPIADAGSRYRRYRGPRIERRVVVRPSYRVMPVRRRVSYARYTVWRSGRGPVIAGFLGGLFLGATLSNAAPRGFTYWDPYCHRGFASLERYDAHCRFHSHEREINVVEVRPGYDQDDGPYLDDSGDSYGDDGCEDEQD